MKIEYDNLSSLTTEDLQDIMATAHDIVAEVNKEIQRYSVIECSICGITDILLRGEELPFVTWSKPSDNFLCPHCTGRFKHGLPKELTMSPVDQIMALMD